ncbi:MAG: hypothetical protein EOM20_21065, partial [Spartobacteria bacterium]|nr:hypothetical protein [Spartobacteria bacterium]
MTTLVKCLSVVLIFTITATFATANDRPRDDRISDIGWGDYTGEYGAAPVDGEQILLRQANDGGFYLLYLNDNGTLYWNADTNNICWTSWSPGSMIATNATAWDIDAIGDVDGDGQNELIMRSSTTFQQGGKTKSEVKTLFFTDNGTGKLKATQPAAFNLATLWTIEGMGNFNTDAVGATSTNAQQILIRHANDGGFYLLYMNDNGSLYWNADTNNVCWTSYSAGSMIATNPTAWVVDSIADVNGDGQHEVIVRSSATFEQGGKTKSYAKVLFFTDNGTGKLKGTQPAAFSLATLWTLEGAGRFNPGVVGAASADAEQALLRHSTDGGYYLLYFNDNGSLYWNADTNNVCWTSYSAGSMIATN